MLFLSHEFKEEVIATRATQTWDKTAERGPSELRKYLEGGLDLALCEASRPGAERVLDEWQEAHIVAMICSKVPEGSSRWSLSLIVKEAIGRGYVESINASKRTGSLP